MEIQPAHQKPKRMQLATHLLWLALLIGPAKILLDSSSIRVVGSPAFLAGAIALAFVLIAFVIQSIANAKNWARYAFLAIFLVAFMLASRHISEVFSRSPLIAFLSLVQLILQAVALWFLFSPSGTAWFREMKARAISR